MRPNFALKIVPVFSFFTLVLISMFLTCSVSSAVEVPGISFVVSSLPAMECSKIFSKRSMQISQATAESVLYSAQMPSVATDPVGVVQFLTESLEISQQSLNESIERVLTAAEISRQSEQGRRIVHEALQNYRLYLLQQESIIVAEIKKLSLAERKLNIFKILASSRSHSQVADDLIDLYFGFDFSTRPVITGSRQPSYSQLLAEVDRMNLRPGQSIVDMRAGVGRLGFLLGIYRPDLQYKGFDTSSARVTEARKVAAMNAMTRTTFELQSSSEASTATALEANWYFINGNFVEDFHEAWTF